jgi:hypothetical protein
MPHSSANTTLLYESVSIEIMKAELYQ